MLKSLANSAFAYLRSHPKDAVKEVVHAAVNATSLRFGVPLDALRWVAGQAKPGKKTPKDIEIGSAPPALRIGATVDAMGTAVRASAAIKIDEVVVSSTELKIGVRLRDVKLALVGDSDSPVATLIKSGALDLSKPGNLVKFIPKRPAAIVEADGDRIVVDLMKVPKIAANRTLRRALSIVTPLLGVRAVETDRDHLYVALKATPAGLVRAVEAFRAPVYAAAR